MPQRTPGELQSRQKASAGRLTACFGPDDPEILTLMYAKPIEWQPGVNKPEKWATPNGERCNREGSSSDGFLLICVTNRAKDEILYRISVVVSATRELATADYPAALEQPTECG